MPILSVRSRSSSVSMTSRRLHLAADAAQRRRRQHAFRRAADAEIDVDAGLRLGAMDHAGDVAVGDQRHRGAGLADRRDHVGMARPVEQDRGDLRRLDALGLGEVAGCSRRPARRDRWCPSDSPGRSRSCPCSSRARAAACRHRPSPWSRSRPACSWRRAIVPSSGSTAMSTLGPVLLPTFSPMNSIGASSSLALADHHRAVDRQLVELAPHRVDRGLVGRLVLAVAAQPRRRHRRALGHAHDLERENALEHWCGWTVIVAIVTLPFETRLSPASSILLDPDHLRRAPRSPCRAPPRQGPCAPHPRWSHR